MNRALFAIFWVIFVFLKLTCTQPSNGHQHMFGNLRPIEPNNTALLSALLQVEPEIERTFGNSSLVHRIDKILQAFSQIVSGVKFYVIFDVVEQSNCLKSAPNCSTFYGTTLERHFLCGAVIWVQTWRNFYHLQNINCTEALMPNFNFSLPVLFDL